MVGEHRFDHRSARASVEAGDRLAADHEHERRHVVHVELAGEIGALVDVDLHDAQALATLARDMRDEALHSPRRSGASGGEKDEQGQGAVSQGPRYALCAGRCKPGATLGALMGDWWTVGILVGLGASIGVAATGALRRAIAGAIVAAVVAVAIGIVFGDVDDAVGGFVGALCGAFGSAPLVSGTLRRGGTRGGTAALLAGASLVGAILAFAPIVGYLEAIAVPVLGWRLRRRSPDRHAGLRTLAKD